MMERCVQQTVAGQPSSTRHSAQWVGWGRFQVTRGLAVKVYRAFNKLGKASITARGPL